jgi:protein-S-isoprenylcysteine O-methyltransferase Ste14
MKQKYFIDSHKSVIFLVILGLMAWFNQWHNPTAWVYLALHGTYGILWLLKSRVFPDKQWEIDKGLPYGLYIWAGLSLYWIAPFIITSQNVQAPAWLLGLSVSMYTFGIFLHYAADMQKYVQLKYNPDRLIDDGLMARTRNINYFGELLIYLGFSLLAMHWIPLAVIALYLVVIWFPNMYKKEKSLSRYPGFEEYKRKSKLFIPFLF